MTLFCEEGQAPAPAHLIEGALPTEGMIAHVLVSKFADHLPLYRQAQIYARSGIDLHRSTLADWVGKASFHLRPVFECLKAELKRSNTLGLDETTVRVLDPGRGKTKTKTGYMWTMARDERGWSGPDPPGCDSNELAFNRTLSWGGPSFALPIVASVVQTRPGTCLSGSSARIPQTTPPSDSNGTAWTVRPPAKCSNSSPFHAAAGNGLPVRFCAQIRISLRARSNAAP